MKRIFFTALCLITVVPFGYADQGTAQLKMLNNNLDPAEGDRLAFEPVTCRFYGKVEKNGLAVINRKVCDGVKTPVTLYVPLGPAGSYQGGKKVYEAQTERP